MSETENTPVETPPDPIGAIHRRLEQLEEFVKHVVEKVEGLIGSARPAVDAVAGAVAHVPVIGPVAKALEVIVDAVPCPDHPKAPQTANGCTEPGCTFSPLTAAPASQGQAEQVE